MEIYTLRYSPFVMGGPTTFPIKTEIGEFERVPIGQGYYGLLVENPVKRLWHMVLEDCGAVIGTNKSKARLLKGIKNDVNTGDPKMMKQQISQGKTDLKNAKVTDVFEFFHGFRGEDRVVKLQVKVEVKNGEAKARVRLKS